MRCHHKQAREQTVTLSEELKGQQWQRWKWREHNKESSKERNEAHDMLDCDGASLCYRASSTGDSMVWKPLRDDWAVLLALKSQYTTKTTHSARQSRLGARMEEKTPLVIIWR